MLTLLRGETLLAKCSAAAPDAYKKLRKGTPFYWLAWAAFSTHDYETAAFYIDAAVADDLKAADVAGRPRQSVSTPALLFFHVDDADAKQALLGEVRQLRASIEDAITAYNAKIDAKAPPLGWSEIKVGLINRSLLVGGEHLRTLVTTLISFLLEWKHRSDLIGLRTELGTAEPFFMHLFKGCVLFESLLKANSQNPPTEKMLGGILKELRAPLKLDPSRSLTISNFDFPTIVGSIPGNDATVFTAIEQTGRIRNTTGHNLGWQVQIDRAAFDVLAGYVASSCLHAIACLYR